MSEFISVDWGTTSFRVRLVQRETLLVLAALQTSYGIGRTFRDWQTSGVERKQFYFSYLDSQIAELFKDHDRVPDRIPVIASGMIGSSIGLTEVPYHTLPIATNGSSMTLETIALSGRGYSQIFIVPGIQTSCDVLRGEETLLIGAAANASAASFYIFPGTHSKHIAVRNGFAEQFTTYMTGEFFELLAKQSVLSSSLEESPFAKDAFQEGVIEGSKKNVLNTAFLARTRQILQKKPFGSNYHFLSGVMIGNELSEVPLEHSHITIVANQTLSNLYVLACQQIWPDKTVVVIDADDALLRGQIILLNQAE